MQQVDHHCISKLPLFYPITVVFVKFLLLIYTLQDAFCVQDRQMSRGDIANLAASSKSHAQLELVDQQVKGQTNTVGAVILQHSLVLVSELAVGKLTARPHMAILPTKTKSAPSATALKISEPRRKPPSMAMRVLPLAIGAISRRISIVAGVVSSCRPPWLEMMIPSTPCSMAICASRGEVTRRRFSQYGSWLSTFAHSPPLTQISRSVWLFIHAIFSSQVAAVS